MWMWGIKWLVLWVMLLKTHRCRPQKIVSSKISRLLLRVPPFCVFKFWLFERWNVLSVGDASVNFLDFTLKIFNVLKHCSKTKMLHILFYFRQISVSSRYKMCRGLSCCLSCKRDQVVYIHSFHYNI